MTHFSDFIVYFWLLPVVLQILIPLVMFISWQALRVFRMGTAKSEKPVQIGTSAGAHPLNGTS